MGFFDDAVPGGNISQPVMLALGSLLMGKLLNQPNAAPDQAGSGQAGAPQPNQGGGLLGGLLSGGVGNLLGGGIGSLLGGGGGSAGGLGGLLQQLNSAGHGQVADSWVGNGPNQSIQPNQLGSALGQTTVSELAQHAGMNEQDLLSELSRVLPGVVDRLTPHGQVPNQEQVASAWTQQG